jgi:hypothetical protein
VEGNFCVIWLFVPPSSLREMAGSRIVATQQAKSDQI